MIQKFLFYIIASTILSFAAKAETIKASPEVTVKVPVTTDERDNVHIERTGGERYYDDRRETNKDRRAVLDRSRDRYLGGRTCEEKDRDHDCHDECREIYTRRADRKDCEELAVAQITNLLDLHESLEYPDDDELAEVNFEDFDVYMNISIAPLDKLIKRYSRTEAKEFMLWLVENDEPVSLKKRMMITRLWKLFWKGFQETLTAAPSINLS